MGISQYDPVAKGRPACNAGKQVGAKRALKVKQIWLIRFSWIAKAGCVTGRYSTLRSTATSRLRPCENEDRFVVSGPAIRNRSMVIQQKKRRGGNIDDLPFQAELIRMYK